MSQQETTNEPEEMIRDTYAPITISMAVMMIFWGLLSHPFGITIWWMSIAGLGLLACGLFSWMKELCYEWSMQDES
ncbi:MAG: hypothetical protein P8J33_16430 [Pirellulaceae bacterium]|nr:hypothetical protein [Pirellulaceae bacterium]